MFVLNRSVGQARSTPDELEVLRAILITETFQDLPEPSHHIFLYLNLLWIILVAAMLASVILNFGNVLELFDFETGTSADALLDVLQRQVGYDVQLSTKYVIHTFTNSFGLSFELGKVACYFLLNLWVFIISFPFLSLVFFTKLKVERLINCSEILLQNFVSNYLLPDSVCQIEAERLPSQETEGQEGTEVLEEIVIFFIGLFIEHESL